MDRAKLDDALDSMTRHDLERMQEEIAKRLRSCVICGSEGAEAFRVTSSRAFGGGALVASILLCKPCFEKSRLPGTRVEAAS
jgi:hypothetical protein